MLLKPISMMKAKTGGGGGYTQNFVDTNGTANLTDAAIGGNEAVFTFSLWIKPIDVDFTQNIWNISGRSSIGKATTNLSVFLKDTSNATLYNSNTTTNPFSVGVLRHIYVMADFAGGELIIEIDGSAPTMGTDVSTFTGGNGTVDLDRSFSMFGNLDAEVSDFAIYNSNISNSLLWNGGTPPDPTTVGSPLVLCGGNMTADERGGNASEGWNDGFNLGSAGALTPSSATFTDA